MIVIHIAVIILVCCICWALNVSCAQFVCTAAFTEWWCVESGLDADGAQSHACYVIKYCSLVLVLPSVQHDDSDLPDDFCIYRIVTKTRFPVCL